MQWPDIGSVAHGGSLSAPQRPWNGTPEYPMATSALCTQAT